MVLVSETRVLPSPPGGEGLGVRGRSSSPLPLGERGRGGGEASAFLPSPPTPLPSGERGEKQPLSPLGRGGRRSPLRRQIHLGLAQVRGRLLGRDGIDVKTGAPLEAGHA